ncbi:DUF2062 domain-containing protein [Aromatoleum toluvorans]|uniref:DUF2062 domain-containing protein n=1 Tax=Aromatoleum toluvorans TaxID=92002 RepID=A0ABX1PX33_9RHOO|nr:DUF2062 domain-containing protein [Aromatoleum toluvorans]NMG42800.1 DUF2062 domain-containing protein [Aromatoleum toluvorans]
MRKTIKRFLPNHESVHNNRWLRPFADTLLHPRLWHLNRHSVAGAIAVGLFCGLIPGPFQALAAAAGCVLFRVNLPLAVVTTLYSNPLTIVPLYVLAYEVGSRALGLGPNGFIKPPELGDLGLSEWMGSMVDWMLGLGKPLALGLVLLAAFFSLVGYVGVKAAWRVWLVRTWHGRRARRSAGS